MARLPYNTSCDLIYGPSGLNPGVSYATGPCRLVGELVQVPSILPLSDRVSYLTLDFAIPNQAKITSSWPTVDADYSYADLVAVPSGIPPNYQILFVESVQPALSPSYLRCHLQRYGSYPPVSGCFGCASSPAQWRVTWPGFGYTFPFNGPSFIIDYVPSSSPACQYLNDFSSGNSASLLFSPSGNNVLTITQSSVIVGTYQNTSLWSCSSSNRLSKTLLNQNFPPYLTLLSL
jgi:hypothetical protein